MFNDTTLREHGGLLHSWHKQKTATESEGIWFTILN
jgi:hypothetical protein